MTLNTLHLRLRDLHIGKEVQKNLITQVNPLSELVDTGDDNSKEIQTSITGDMTDSMNWNYEL